MEAVLKNRIENRMNSVIDLSTLKDKKLLLCVSGGMDSVFLYHNILDLQSKYNFKVGMAHVNYNTSVKSDDSMELCRELSKLNNHPFYLKVYSRAAGSNFEHLAREFRYSFFKSIKDKESYDYIITAHNKDDLIETIYMQNQKDDFSILPYSQSPGDILRPLININREEIEYYIKSEDLLHYNDPTNLDSKYKRNDVRINIFPKLKDRDELFKKLLNNYYLKVKKYNEFRSEYSNNKGKFMEYNPSLNILKIDTHYLRTLSLYLFKLIFQGALNEKFNLKISKTKKYWEELYRQITSNNKSILLDIDSSLSASSDSKFVYIHKLIGNYDCKKIIPELEWGNGVFLVNEILKIKAEDIDDKNVFICSKEVYDEGLYVRKWFHGDKISTSNNQTKLISDLFNELKIIPLIRTTKPIILCEDTIQWIPGVSTSKNNYLENKIYIRIEWVESR